jgi:hypothetical protein
MVKTKTKKISRLMLQFHAHVLLIYELIEELIINNQLNIKQLQQINQIRENLIYLLNLQNQFIITSRIAGKQADDSLPDKETLKKNKKTSGNSDSALIHNENEIRRYLRDKQFLDLAMEVVEKHLRESKFGGSAFSREMKMNRSSISRNYTH